MLEDRDSFAVIEALADPPADPLNVVQAYFELVHDLYWKNKDIQVVALGRAGIQFGLGSAIELEARDPERALKFRHTAKAIACNLASFTWPGWKQDGVVIGDFERNVGFDAAKANLRLTKKIRKGTQAVSNAYWLLGAHHPAARRLDDARRMFVRSRNMARRAQAESGELLSVGFIHVTELIEHPSDAEARKQLDEIKARLLAQKDGESYTVQFDDALATFLTRE